MSTQQEERLISVIEPLLAPLGYQTVAIELHSHGQRKLQIFIDHATLPSAGEKTAIGIEDCVRATKALDEPLDQSPEIEAIFRGHSYELEVSSPGIDRPLRTAGDYKRFTEERARVHLFRPLNADELGNTEHQKKNPKQKNFIGIIKGFENEKILFLDQSSDRSGSSVTIPLGLVSKAHLEPEITIESEKKKGKTA